MNAPLDLLSFSQACQSTLHLKSEEKIFVGQFLVTKVTDGQQIEQPKQRIDLLMHFFEELLKILIGSNRMRLVFNNEFL